MTTDNLVDALAARMTAKGAYIEPHDHSTVIAALEQMLPGPLPPSFRSFVTRYSFLAFEIVPLEIFSNIGEETTDEWTSRIFADKFMSSTLLTNGYIQFARPDTGSYDPICFDIERKRGDGEYPIVWIDHEGILCHDKIVVRSELAPSFVELVQAYLVSA